MTGSPGRITTATQLPTSPYSRLNPNHYQRTAVTNAAANRGGVRRSSAAGIIQRPPLPPNNTIGTRSHSLDGLLDAAAITKTAAGTANAPHEYTEGASENTQHIQTPHHRKNNTLAPIHGSDDAVDSVSSTSTNHRRSRSMEDLLDEHNENVNGETDATPGCEDRSKSMENLMDDIAKAPIAVIQLSITPNDHTDKTNDTFNFKDVVSIGSASSLNAPSIEQPCGSESITIDNAIIVSSQEKPAIPTQSSIDENIGDEGDTISTTPSAYSRQGSTTSSKESEKKKTFLNRYVKKVKSFIKK